VYYFHTHINGAPEELTDEAGQTLWRARYRTWGSLALEEADGRLPSLNHWDGDATRQPVRMQGQYVDSETGLYYNTFRYYDPDIGRFISEDPIGLWGGLNLYQFAANADAWADPLGLRNLWALTPAGTSQSKVIGGRTYYKHKTTELWWSRDTAGHGGSEFKVFEEGKGGSLIWHSDADKFGDFIHPAKKHKGPKGKKICY
jgi:RHS repeat-associated protein